MTIGERYSVTALTDPPIMKIEDTLRATTISNPRRMLDWSAGEFDQDDIIGPAHFIGEHGVETCLEILRAYFDFVGKRYDASQHLDKTLKMLAVHLDLLLSGPNRLAALQKHDPNGLTPQVKDALTKFCDEVERRGKNIQGGEGNALIKHAAVTRSAI